jgi:uncharacterized protein (DUF2267 family)
MRGGIPDQATAERSLRATLGSLGQRLTDDEAAALAGQLPKELARVLDQSEYDGDFDAAEFYERVRRREKTLPGLEREHADIVLRALGEVLDLEVRAGLIRALPDAIGQRLLAPELGPPPPHPTATHAPSLSTLARGRPGSRHPVSEAAAPASGQTHSVARSDNPHGDTKLSSAHGLTQERLDETLATGQTPGPTRPISEANDD